MIIGVEAAAPDKRSFVKEFGHILEEYENHAPASSTV